MLFGIHSTKYELFLFCTLSICSSTSFVDMRPRKRPHAVRYRPWRGSAAHIMFFASNICCVSSGTVSARYCCEPRDVNGEKPTMKKCKRGKGMHVITPLIDALTRWFKSPYVGVVSFRVRKQMSYSASLSRSMHSSAFSTNWWKERTAL